jgi:Flp pilus assembly protein TadG
MPRNSRLRRLAKEEDGFSLVFVGLGCMAFVAASMLAIDVGMLMTARSQAQNSADAGALAGATALVFNSWTDRSATGPAVTNALTAARSNQVMAASVSVTAPDVQFLNDPSGNDDRVKVTVYRESSRGNPISTLVAQYFGVSTVGVNATATAEASPANAATCVKPFTIPDKWQENTTPPWNPASSTFDYYKPQGQLWTNQVLATHDVYIPADQPGHTGYDMFRDVGTLLMIRAGNGNQVAPSMYFSWDMPGGTGGSWYRDNIAGCNTTIVHWGDPITQEPGAMSGPTAQGAQDLIDRDSNAYWDTAKNRVVTTMHPSPRIFPIPLYDPLYYQSQIVNGRNATLKVANWIGFFLDHVDGNNIYGRITPIPGILDHNAGPAPQGTFPRVIRLVQ